MRCIVILSLLHFKEVEEEIEKIIDSFESKVAESDRELNEQGNF